MNSTLAAPPPIGTVSCDRPFPGLRAYEENESAWFFGRGREINELLKRLRRARFLAVVGPSGCGKSSLVKAGILPNVRDGYLDAVWDITTLRPGEQPIQTLAESIAGLTGAEPANIQKMLRSGSLGLVQALEAAAPPPRNTLLVVDQFEELFQFVQRKGEAAREEVKAFLKLLLAAAAFDEAAVYIVITMRVEWLSESATYTGLAEAINEGLYVLPQMSRRQYQQAILGPIEAAGGSVTSALLDRMLNDLDSRTDQLPVLQHALMRMWGESRAGDVLDVPLYESPKVGTLSNCLNRHAEEIYTGLSAGERRAAELLFRSITQVVKSRRVRRPRALKSISELTGLEPQRFEPVIEEFRKEGRSFLVTSPGPLTGESIIDISHEALIRQWNRLTEWVDDEAKLDEKAARLEGAAAQWMEDKKKYRFALYRGEYLADAERLRDRVDSKGPVAEFLKASRRADRWGRVWPRLVFLLVVILAGALGWTDQNGQYKEARKDAQIAQLRADAAQRNVLTAQTQAQRSNEVTQQLIKDVTGKKSPQEILASIERIQAPRIYMQYSGAGQAPLALSIQADLRHSGYTVPKPENIRSKAPPGTEVRFFNDSDKATADTLVNTLKSSVSGPVGAKKIDNPGNVVPAGQLEVWLGTGTGPIVTPSKDPAQSPAPTQEQTQTATQVQTQTPIPAQQTQAPTQIQTQVTAAPPPMQQQQAPAATKPPLQAVPQYRKMRLTLDRVDLASHTIRQDWDFEVEMKVDDKPLSSFPVKVLRSGRTAPAGITREIPFGRWNITIQDKTSHVRERDQVSTGTWQKSVNPGSAPEFEVKAQAAHPKNGDFTFHFKMTPIP